MVWEYGLISALAGIVAVETTVIWLLLARIPGPEQIYGMMQALADEKIKEFGLSAPKHGPRGTESLVDRILAIPGIQEMIANALQSFGKGGGQTPLLRR